MLFLKYNMNIVKEVFVSIKDFFMSLIVYNLIGTTVSSIFSRKDFYNEGNTIKEIQRKLKNFNNKEIAILVSGSGRIVSFVMGFRGTFNQAYSSLKKRGYEDEQIILLSSSFPRDPEKGINASPTSENLSLILKSLRKKASFLFYFTGHGHYRNRESTLVLENGELSESELYNYAKKIKGKKIMIFDQCHSGGFFQKMQTLKNIVILASTTKDKGASNIPSVEMLFWKKIGNKEEVTEAYQKASKEISFGDKLAMSIISLVTMRTFKNYYLTFKENNVDTPIIKQRKIKNG